MGLVALLIVVLAGLGIAGGVGVALVQTNHPDRVVQLDHQPDTEVIKYGGK